MKPFRNSGWLYYDKFQTILPNASARGSHAFSASTSTFIEPTLGDEGTNEPGDGSGNVASSGPINADEASLMASTAMPAPSAPASTQRSNKRRASSHLHDDDLVAFDEVSHSTTPGTSASGTGRKRSRPSASPFASSVSETNSRKMSTGLFLHGMQGSINRLTDALSDALKPESQDPLFYDKSESSAAIARLQRLDDGLSQADKADLTIIFSESPGTVNAYMQLHDAEVRIEYLRKILARFRS